MDGTYQGRGRTARRHLTHSTWRGSPTGNGDNTSLTNEEKSCLNYLVNSVRQETDNRMSGTAQCVLCHPNGTVPAI